VRLFDVYTGDQIEPGKRSLAFTLTFRSSERTLTSDDVAVRRHGVVEALATAFGAELRG
jgi:phenylalanyl-tRNA synthetase beta chain